MPKECQKCRDNGLEGSKFHRIGFFYRTSDSRIIQRYRCSICKFNCSQATFQSCYKQKKRQKNDLLRQLLCSGVSLRRSARILRVHRVTVVRKFLFLSLQAEFQLKRRNLLRGPAQIIEFDDLETFEHTKCKPLSVTLAVESGTRRILGIEVSQMQAKGLLVEKAKKYGRRFDMRKRGRNRMFRRIEKLVFDGALIKSDSNPHYDSDVKKWFPKSKHQKFLGKRGAITGQGELKKIGYDPLFSLNHTCAMLRANINRLARKTWCTTKQKEQLYRHLVLYSDYHNQNLK